MRKTNLMKSIAKAGICSAIVLSTFTFGPSVEQASAATPKSINLIANSKQYLGTPYKFGAPAGVTYAFDCSSFTQYIFGAMNVSLPRTSSAQAKLGEKVPKSSLSMGDLVFFNTNGKSISHVGVYAGSNKFISATSKGVTVADMSSSYWSNKYVTAKRVL